MKLADKAFNAANAEARRIFISSMTNRQLAHAVAHAASRSGEYVERGTERGDFGRTACKQFARAWWALVIQLQTELLERMTRQPNKPHA